MNTMREIIRMEAEARAPLISKIIVKTKRHPGGFVHIEGDLWARYTPSLYAGTWNITGEFREPA